jgi:hypothetical protein
MRKKHTLKKKQNIKHLKQKQMKSITFLHGCLRLRHWLPNQVLP